MLSDAKANNDKYFVDGRLFFNCQDWNIEQGGFTSYISKDEDEELLTALPNCLPENNTLQLIYKDAQTLGFVKYVNDGINVLPNGEFHDISVAYFGTKEELSVDSPLSTILFDIDNTDIEEFSVLYKIPGMISNTLDQGSLLKGISSGWLRLDLWFKVLSVLWTASFI